MQAIAILACALLLLATGSASPARQRYMWIPDGEGELHLVDLEQVDTSPHAVDGDSEVTLYLYTSKNPSSAQIIKRGDIKSAPNFNPAYPTRFLTHGWNSNSRGLTKFASAYLSVGEYNVVLVDWTGPASAFYTTAVTNTRLVGEYLATVIEDLVNNRRLSLDDVSLIGHSLGGQLVGVTGNRLGGKVAQVVGLDAAGPLFNVVTSKNRLDASDGVIVQGIHTNGGLLGWKDPLGDIDFFPNGGSTQAGCILDVSGSCSHGRAPTYFLESITNNQFVGVLCDSYDSFTAGRCNNNARDVLGEHVSVSTPGNYYMKTNSRSPYALGDVA